MLRIFRPVTRTVVPTRFQQPTPRPPLHVHDSFASGANAAFLEDLERQYQEDPNSVDASWREFFSKCASSDLREPVYEKFTRPPAPSKFVTGELPAADNVASLEVHIKATALLVAHQRRGHLIATIDPLNLADRSNDPRLTLEYHGLRPEDMDKTIMLGRSSGAGFRSSGAHMKLSELVAAMKKTYCGNIGYEYAHITDIEQLKWLQARIEVPTPELSFAERCSVFDHVARAELMEIFLDRKFSTHKRFGLDGAESLIAILNVIMDTARAHNVTHIVYGMPHRGRLNVLHNVAGKPMEAILVDFDKQLQKIPVEGSGDVKYHLGMSADRATPHGDVHVSLMANPSHLEAVNPVVMGKTRAKMHYLGDSDGSQVMSLLMHGDASYSGQGVVFECNAMANLDTYTNYGTVHVVVNNQIGFTTDPSDGRSSRHPTGIAAAMEAPIFHVNGDDPEACARVAKLAVDFRMRFRRDVVIDLVCYRRFGHNETDQPMFTQPKMYNVIAKHPRLLQTYTRKVVEDGVMTEEEVRSQIAAVDKSYSDALDASKHYETHGSEWLDSHWKGYAKRKHLRRTTAVPLPDLRAGLAAMCSLPEDFEMHKLLKQVFARRAAMLEDPAEATVDWATAELLAFASLIQEGYHVRLSGQDCERGTFSQRHAVVHCQKSYHAVTPLKALKVDPAAAKVAKGRATFEVMNSPLSEYGVLGFELGYSMEHPDSLVLWEAQFGDFSNTAQCIFDQFLCSGEEKWLRQCGLTVLLPHGFDGQGPEHSSGRLERLLIMGSESEVPPPTLIPDDPFPNWSVVMCTTAANHFHVLRRQLKRPHRIPLLCFVSKMMLRAPTSSGDELANGEFQPISNVLAAHPDAELVWSQEEPRNMGAWTFVAPRLRNLLKHAGDSREVSYTGRTESGSVSTGFPLMHEKETADILAAVFGPSS